jgi:hypothetical protein
MTERKSKCPFAALTAFGRKISGHDAPVAVTAATAGPMTTTVPAAPATQTACAEAGGSDEEILAYRTLLRHASIVRGARGNLLILPSISLPSGDLADAPAAIRAWLAKVPPAH